MAEKSNATCSICGKPYYVCMSCKDAMKSQPWKAFVDTVNCYKVFQVVKGLSTRIYTKDEAKEKFENIDLSDIESFRPHIRDIVKDVLREDKKVTEPVVEATTEESVEEIAERPIYSRKRNFKIENVETE